MVTARERMRLQQVGQDAEQAQLAQAEGQVIAQDAIDNEIAQKQAQQMRQSRYADDMNASAQGGRMQGQIEGQEQERINMLNSMNPNPPSSGIPFDYNQELPDPQGLQMGSQTIEGMQQLEGERQNAMMQEANATADQAIDALRQGMDPQEIDAMIDQNVPPEMNGMVKEILNQKIIDMSNQQQELNATSGSGQVQTGRPPSPVTAAANDILAQSMQTMQPQQPQQQQQQPMR